MLQWLKYAGIRAIKTFAQSLVGAIAIGTPLAQIEWWHALSIGATAAILSLLTSIAGLPEHKKEDTNIVTDQQETDSNEL